MWSEHAFTRPLESASAMDMTNALDDIKAQVEGSKAVNVITVVKEGLTSRELILNAKKYDYLKTQMQTNSRMYSNLREQFDTVAFA